MYISKFKFFIFFFIIIVSKISVAWHSSFSFKQYYHTLKFVSNVTPTSCLLPSGSGEGVVVAAVPGDAPHRDARDAAVPAPSASWRQQSCLQRCRPWRPWRWPGLPATCWLLLHDGGPQGQTLTFLYKVMNPEPVVVGVNQEMTFNFES